MALHFCTVMCQGYQNYDDVWICCSRTAPTDKRDVRLCRFASEGSQGISHNQDRPALRPALRGDNPHTWIVCPLAPGAKSIATPRKIIRVS